MLWTIFWLVVLAALLGAWLSLDRPHTPRTWADDAQSQANRRAFRRRVSSTEWSVRRDPTDRPAPGVWP